MSNILEALSLGVLPLETLPFRTSCYVLRSMSHIKAVFRCYSQQPQLGFSQQVASTASHVNELLSSSAGCSHSPCWHLIATACETHAKTQELPRPSIEPWEITDCSFKLLSFDMACYAVTDNLSSWWVQFETRGVWDAWKTAMWTCSRATWIDFM